MQEKFGLSERRACGVVKLPRTTKRYELKPKDDSRVLNVMHKIIKNNPRFGCPRVQLFLRREGVFINHKRTHRIYAEAGLQLGKRPPKRRRRRPVTELPPAMRPRQKWSMDFVHDNLADGRAIRVLTILDEFTRECMAMEVDTSLNSSRVISVLERIETEFGLPDEFGLDSGPEFTSLGFSEWAKSRGISVGYCTPGKKNENAFIESFNARLRDECLNMHWFLSLCEARQIIEDWREDYNFVRPHSSLGGLSPTEYFDGQREILIA